LPTIKTDSEICCRVQAVN